MPLITITFLLFVVTFSVFKNTGLKLNLKIRWDISAISLMTNLFKISHLSYNQWIPLCSCQQDTVSGSGEATSDFCGYSQLDETRHEKALLQVLSEQRDSEKELKGAEKIHGGGEWNTSKPGAPRLEFSRKVEGNKSDTTLVLQAVNASKVQILF